MMAALFQSITALTAGFNTLDTGALSNASKFFLILLMFIGASPASTGGGIKTTTAAMVLLMAAAVIRGREENELFHRRIPMAITVRALAIALISLSALIGVTMLLSLLEQVPFLDILFQSASALGTVGLSTMDTGGMRDVSKVLITITMFMGRVGPLTLTLALAQRQSRSKPVLKHPEERVMVG
jgi:trk system potassium uptake protein TrkH